MPNISNNNNNNNNNNHKGKTKNKSKPTAPSLQQYNELVKNMADIKKALHSTKQELDALKQNAITKNSHVKNDESSSQQTSHISMMQSFTDHITTMNIYFKPWFNGSLNSLSPFINDADNFLKTNNIHDPSIAFRKIYAKLGEQVQLEFSTFLSKKMKTDACTQLDETVMQYSHDSELSDHIKYYQTHNDVEPKWFAKFSKAN